MLVLTRSVGQQLVINGRVVVTVTEVRGRKVRLGVSAPSDVPVDRKEVHDRRQALAPAGPAARR
jgi:carbon storage regulator